MAAEEAPHSACPWVCVGDGGLQGWLCTDAFPGGKVGGAQFSESPTPTHSGLEHIPGLWCGFRALCLVFPQQVQPCLNFTVKMPHKSPCPPPLHPHRRQCPWLSTSVSGLDGEPGGQAGRSVNPGSHKSHLGLQSNRTKLGSGLCHQITKVLSTCLHPTRVGKGMSRFKILRAKERIA